MLAIGFLWLSVTVACVAIVFGIAGQDRQPSPRALYTVLHPGMWLVALLVLVGADFLVTYRRLADGLGIEAHRVLIIGTVDVKSAAILYAFWAAAVAIGAAFSIWAPHARRTQRVWLGGSVGAREGTYVRALELLGWVLMGFVAWRMVSQGYFEGGTWTLRGLRTLIGREDKLLGVSVLTVYSLPLLLYKWIGTRRSATILALACLVVAVVWGSRLNILLGVYVFLVRMLEMQKKWLAAQWAGAGILFLISAPLFGLIYDQKGIGRLEAQGVMEIFFLPEVGFVEGAVATLRECGNLGRTAWTALALVVVPWVPRSIWLQKPMGLSAELTQRADPERWLQTGSEWTVGGVADVFCHFGMIGVLISGVVVGFTLLRLARWPNSVGMRWWPVLAGGTVLFVRADLYNLALKAWVILLTWLAASALAWMWRVLQVGSPVNVRRNHVAGATQCWR